MVTVSRLTNQIVPQGKKNSTSNPPQSRRARKRKRQRKPLTPVEKLCQDILANGGAIAIQKPDGSVMLIGGAR